MKTNLIYLLSFLSLTSVAQEKFDAEKFLSKALENYATAKATAIDVTINLYEKSDKKQNSFRCISKKKGEKSYLKIRNTDLITTDSLRLFVDHNNKYIHLQKVTKKVDSLKGYDPINFADQLKSNSKEFIDASIIEHTERYTVFINEQEDLGFSVSYYFNNNNLLLEKIVNHYNDAEAPYEKIEMIYATNLNEKKEPIRISVKDYLAVNNSKITLRDAYKNYEFVNQSKDE